MKILGILQQLFHMYLLNKKICKLERFTLRCEMKQEIFQKLCFISNLGNLYLSYINPQGNDLLLHAVLAVNGFQETILHALLDKLSSFVLAKARKKSKADLLKQITVSP